MDTHVLGEDCCGETQSYYALFDRDDTRLLDAHSYKACDLFALIFMCLCVYVCAPGKSR